MTGGISKTLSGSLHVPLPQFFNVDANFISSFCDWLETWFDVIVY